MRIAGVPFLWAAPSAPQDWLTQGLALLIRPQLLRQLGQLRPAVEEGHDPLTGLLNSSCEGMRVGN